MRRSLLPILILSALSAKATVWQVGPSQTYTLPSQVAGFVQNGDTVDIAAGVYMSDVTNWTADDLLLRGVGGHAQLESNGLSWGDKAIWVIQGDRTTVEWITFSECTSTSQNGAGIRQEGHDLTVRHCLFHDNENGILAGALHPSVIRIEHSEFDHNGYGDGFSHNLYIGAVDSLIFRYNYSHHAHVGHELKSRAWVNVIEYNRIGNEASGDASREIDLPDGGQAYVIGNAIQQGLQGQNSNLVGFAMESTSNPGPHELYVIGNTLVNEKTAGSFFQAPTSIFLKVYGNILAGGGSFTNGAPPTNLDILGNLFPSSIASVGFADTANYDYHITTSSPAHAMGYPGGVATSGYPLVAWYEYVHPLDFVLRCQHATLDAGAFETCTITGMAEADEEDILIYPNPATDRLFLGEAGAWTAAVIVDACGRTAFARVVDRQWIDVGELAPGLYALVLADGPHTTRVTFIKD